jgi:hypothetical protein
MASTVLPASKPLAVAFGLLMVVCTGVPTHGPGLAAAVSAAAAVIAGGVYRHAATVAVVITVGLLAYTAPAPVLAMLSGLSATAYLVMQHGAGAGAATVTYPSVVGALSFSALGLVAASFPLHIPWLPVMAPVAVVALYIVVVMPFSVPSSDQTSFWRW